jgi:hypothetical protein
LQPGEQIHPAVSLRGTVQASSFDAFALRTNFAALLGLPIAHVVLKVTAVRPSFPPFSSQNSRGLRLGLLFITLATGSNAPLVDPTVQQVAAAALRVQFQSVEELSNSLCLDYAPPPSSPPSVPPPYPLPPLPPSTPPPAAPPPSVWSALSPIFAVAAIIIFLILIALGLLMVRLACRAQHAAQQLLDKERELEIMRGELALSMRKEGRLVGEGGAEVENDVPSLSPTPLPPSASMLTVTVPSPNRLLRYALSNDSEEDGHQQTAVAATSGTATSIASVTPFSSHHPDHQQQVAQMAARMAAAMVESRLQAAEAAHAVLIRELEGALQSASETVAAKDRQLRDMASNALSMISEEQRELRALRASHAANAEELAETRQRLLRLRARRLPQKEIIETKHVRETIKEIVVEVPVVEEVEVVREVVVEVPTPPKPECSSEEVQTEDVQLATAATQTHPAIDQALLVRMTADKSTQIHDDKIQHEGAPAMMTKGPRDRLIRDSSCRTTSKTSTTTSTTFTATVGHHSRVIPARGEKKVMVHTGKEEAVSVEKLSQSPTSMAAPTPSQDADHRKGASEGARGALRLPNIHQTPPRVAPRALSARKAKAT